MANLLPIGYFQPPWLLFGHYLVWLHWVLCSFWCIFGLWLNNSLLGFVTKIMNVLYMRIFNYWLSKKLHLPLKMICDNRNKKNPFPIGEQVNYSFLHDFEKLRAKSLALSHISCKRIMFFPKILTWKFELHILTLLSLMKKWLPKNFSWQTFSIENS